MAIFNPDVGGVPSPNMPDQTGASRGSTPNRSFEALFEGVGGIVKGAAELADYGIQETIKADVRGGFDKEMKPYNDTVPVELANGTNNIQSLQTAYEQGKISDVYFYGQLTALSKALRSKYPGYEAEVDAAIQNITGVRPANSYRNAIVAQFEEQQRTAKEEASKWDTWVKQNEAIILQLFPDYFENPDKYSQTEIRQATASRKAQLAVVDQTNAEITMLINQGRLTDERAAESANITLSQTVNTFMGSLGNTVGFNGDDLLKKVMAANKAGFSPEEFNEISSTIGNAEGALRFALLNEMNKVIGTDDGGNPITYSSLLGTEETKRQIDAAMSPFLAIKDMVANKEFGLAGYYTRLNSLGAQRDLNTLLNSSPELRGAMALREVSPDLSELFITSSGLQDSIFSKIVPELTARVATGKDEFDRQVEAVVNSNASAVDKSNGLNALINTSTQAILSGELTPEQFSSTVKSVYGLTNEDRPLFSYIDPGEYQKLFIRMYNPEVTNAIIANGSRQDLDLYYASARETLKSVPEFSKAAAAVSDIDGWSKNLDVVFTGNRLDVQITDPSSLEGDIFRWDVRENQLTLRRVRDATEAVNNAFSMLSPMLDGLGVDESMKAGIYKEVLKDLWVDVEQGKRDGLFEWLGSEIGNFLSQADDASVTSNKEEYSFNLFSQPAFSDNGSFTGYLDAVRQAESGGDDTAANPRSSATGRYQFLDSTANSYMRRLGLTGDKNDPANQEAMMQAFTADNATSLSNAGIPLTNSNLYAAHFLGAEGAIEVLSSSGDTLISEIVSPKVIKANPHLNGMTVNDFKRWTSKAVGDRVDVAENISEEWLLKRHEKLMEELLRLTGPDDPRREMLEMRSRNNTRWYNETYRRNRET